MKYEDVLPTFPGIRALFHKPNRCYYYPGIKILCMHVLVNEALILSIFKTAVSESLQDIIDIRL